MDKKRYAVSEKPVNRRTAPRELRTPDRPKPTRGVQERLTQMTARRLLGAPLLAVATASPARRQSPATTVVLPLVAVLGALGSWLFLPGMTGSLLALTFVGIVAASIVRSAVLGRQISAYSRQELDGLSLDADSLRKLDATLEKVAVGAPQAVIDALKGAKLELSELIKASQAGSREASWALEDRAYLQQCVERYLPDSVEAYLRIESARRHEPVSGTPLDAHALLIDQLQIIQRELARRRKHVEVDAGDQLVNQHRFLRTKEGSR
jgi:hypothetical protein